MSDDPFPPDYPLPGEGWTILEGEEAREFWETAKTAWLAEFQGHGSEDEVTEETSWFSWSDEPSDPAPDEPS